MNAVIPADCESGRSAALTADIAQLVILTNADRTKIIAGDLKAQQDAAAAVVKIQQANAAIADVFSQMDIDLQSQRDQILEEMQSAIAQRQQTWDMYVLVQRQKMAELSGGRITVPNDAYGFPGTLLETWSWSQYFSPPYTTDWITPEMCWVYIPESASPALIQEITPRLVYGW